MGFLLGPGCCFGGPFRALGPKVGPRSARAKAQLRRAVVREPSGGPPGFKSALQAAITRVASNRQARFIGFKY